MVNNTSVKGFTLLEILLVVLIVSIMTAVGSNLLNSQSVERLVLNQAQKFSDDLTFLCEKSVLENQAYGLELSNMGYQALIYQQPDWLWVESSVPPIIKEGIALDLILGGLSTELAQEISSEDEHDPHIICQSDGSFNVFELRFSAATELSETGGDNTYYALSAETPWQLKGAWYQPQ